MNQTNVNLIWKPDVFLVGQTQMNESEVLRYQQMIEKEIAPKKATKIRDLVENNTMSDAEKLTELAGRICYQSYAAGRESEEYAQHIMEDAHGSVTEHSVFNTILTGASRSFSHQLERHRVGVGISEMSQRFVGANEKSGQWNFVVPAIYRHMTWNENDETEIENMLLNTAQADIQKYTDIKNDLTDAMKRAGLSGRELTKTVNEAAREFLPSWVETRVFWSVNIRALRHILEVRGSEHADQQIRDWAVKLYQKIAPEIPFYTSDIVKTPEGSLEFTYHKI